jgi:hypothetical protein
MMIFSIKFHIASYLFNIDLLLEMWPPKKLNYNETYSDCDLYVPLQSVHML